MLSNFTPTIIFMGTVKILTNKNIEQNDIKSFDSILHPITKEHSRSTAFPKWMQNQCRHDEKSNFRVQLGQNGFNFVNIEALVTKRYIINLLLYLI